MKSNSLSTEINNNIIGRYRYNTLKILDHKYFNLTAIIWYPVLNIENNDLFIESIRKLGSNRITRIELPLKKYNEEIGMKGSGIILFNGNNFLINNMKDCVKELYQIFRLFMFRLSKFISLYFIEICIRLL